MDAMKSELKAPLPAPMPFDEAMRRVLMVKPEKPKPQANKPKSKKGRS
jgi:hypothetical protein